MGLKNFGFIDQSFVESVREKFIEKYGQNSDLFYKEDVDKVLNSDWFVKRFLILAYKKEDDAVKYIHDALVWRKQSQIRTTPDNYFPAEFYKLGAVFPFEKDKNEIPSLVLRIECVKKTPEINSTIQRFMMHRVFQIDEEADGNGWMMVFDFQNCGYSAYEHLDMLRFLVTSLHYYFPAGIDYVLAYDMPWVLKTVWNLVKYWLPPKRRSMVQFANGPEIFNYFDQEKLPDFLGGSSTRNYREIPPKCPSAFNFGISELGLLEDEILRIIDVYRPYLS